MKLLLILSFSDTVRKNKYRGTCKATINKYVCISNEAGLLNKPLLNFINHDKINDNKIAGISIIFAIFI
ncbi:hypothetical protein CaldiYA01_00350 [Caldicellulosiruptor diazotrophicus]|uniref:Uncharacterized protein n=1 Tax=Caldicellulosiruptor diazotrophicus TaxID=2806205 RepID=A0ABN6E411_9FIRM|nr:hypothetical protein CaldiYA01_00350 [Caldicellulosiruptor diazotrophicus]